MASRASRDLGLQRIGTATRVLAVGGLVVGGVLSAAVAKALPGRSGHPGSHGTVSQAPALPATGGSTGSQGTSSTPLNAPSQAPAPVTNPPIVSSGGS